MPCVLNAANEAAVGLFLRDQIGFYDIPRLIEEALAHTDFCRPTTVDEYLEIDKNTKQTILQSFSK